MLFYSRKNRPFELGPYPLERLSHDKSIIAIEANKPQVFRPEIAINKNENSFSKAISKYKGMFSEVGVVDPLPNKAPVPDDLALRTKDVKGAAYFLDAAQVGICELVENSPVLVFLLGFNPSSLNRTCLNCRGEFKLICFPMNL